jgi:Spy/CpxP family protein refolding chaperone
MSFISSVASSSIFATTIANSTTSSLRPFANLDLTEQQRTQIRAIFQQAKSQGLSQTQIQQQINAILTPAQQTTLQNDIAQFQSQNASSTANSSSTSSQTQAPPNPFADPNGPFANLNLTASQQSQIAQILQSAPAQGLTFDQVNSKISAILTTAQQATFQTDLKNLPAPPQGPPPGANGSNSSSSSSTSADDLDNLTLTTTQQTQIDSILQEAQSGTITQAQALAQITSLLTPAQQSLLQQAEQTAQTQVSGRRHDRDGGDASSTSGTSTATSVATLPNGVTETDIKNQVAAATSIILNQLQNEVATG